MKKHFKIILNSVTISGDDHIGGGEFKWLT
jgi:hypothetical protein